jgi:hypothetical protein
MPKNLNPQDVATKWANGMANGVTAYKQGVSNVQVSPTESAAQKASSYLAGVQDAYNSGRYVNGLRAVSLQDWQNQAINTGANRLASGASAAKSKVTNFLTQFLPAVSSIQAQVNAMPSDTYEGRKARATAMMDALHKLKGNFKQHA